MYLTLLYGSPPWIALTLACSFGLYGLIKKLAPLGSLHGLTLETGVLLVPMLAYLIFVGINGQGAFLRADLASNLLMIGAGPVTVIPLLLFASAVRRIPLSTMGILQYIAPTLQFLLGVLVYREAFSSSQFIGFGLVWLGVIVFTARMCGSAAVPCESSNPFDIAPKSAYTPQSSTLDQEIRHAGQPRLQTDDPPGPKAQSSLSISIKMCSAWAVKPATI